MSSLASLTAQLSAGRELSPEQVEAALAALADKGETPAEVAAFAAAFRARAVDPRPGTHAGIHRAGAEGGRECRDLGRGLTLVGQRDEEGRLEDRKSVV